MGGGQITSLKMSLFKAFPETDVRIEPSSAAFIKNLQKVSLTEACSGSAIGEVGIS